MDALQAGLVGGGAFLAGGMNALAGGGTFFSFPALLAAGVAPVTANASNTVALWPASLSGAWAYRRELGRDPRRAARLLAVSLAGGVAGSLLLLATSDHAFSRLIPWLLLAATLLFAFSARIARLAAALKARLGVDGNGGGLLFQAAVAVYGGFFGAGLGILTLAALSIQGIDDVQELNGLKNLCSAANYSMAAATFLMAGAVSWPHTVVMLATAFAGGLAGASLARRLPARWLRRLVIGTGGALTLTYFIKTYF